MIASATLRIAARQTQAAGGSRLTSQDREYLTAWENLPEELASQMISAGIDGPIKPDSALPPARRIDEDEEYDPLDHIAAPQISSDEFREDHADPSAVAAAMGQLLFALTDSAHPLRNLLSTVAAPTLFASPRDCEIALDCLALAIAKSDEDSQAAVARKYEVERATINKRVNHLRKNATIKLLQSFAHGGRPEASNAARERATRVHATLKKPDGKPSPFSKIICN